MTECLDDALNLAIAHHRMGRLDEAERLYAEILGVEREHVDALHLSGILRHQAGQPAMALGRVRCALAARPDFAGAYNSLGNILADAGQFEGAIEAYRRATRLQDGYADALVNLGTVFEAQDRFADALAVYDEAHRLDPGSIGARYNLGRMHERMGRLEQAAACFYAVVTASPDHAGAWRALALSMRSLDHPDAELCLRRALSDTPGDAQLALELGTLLNEQHRYDEAAAVLRPSIAANPAHSRLHFALGSAWQGLRRFEPAAACYRRTLAGEPHLSGPWNNLGMVLAELDRNDEAVVALRVCLALSPSHAVALNNLGTSLESLARPDEAMRVYRRSLLIRPEYEKALNNLGNVCKNCRRHDEALRLHRMAIASSPDFSDAYTSLGVAVQDLDRWAEAERLHRRAIQLAPSHTGALTGLGLALHMLGQIAEAEAAHLAALAIDDRHAEAYANLGMLQWQSNRVEEAEVSLRRAIEADPSLGAAHLNFALVTLAKGKLGIGWDDYAWRFRAKGYQDRAIDAPVWQGEPMPGKRLLVWREQGVGDEILFASCFPALAGHTDHLMGGHLMGGHLKGGHLVIGHLVIECDRRLVSLFARSFPDATVRPESLDAEGRETIVPLDCDAHIAAGALPRLLRPTITAFPHDRPWLVPDPQRVEQWRERVEALGPGLKVGIAWRSQMMTTDRKAAYVTLDAFAPLFAVPGLVFVNLQYGDCAAEIAAAEARFGPRIHCWDDLNLKDDFEGAAALTVNLDLVITPAMSAGELAGALGVPVWRFGFVDWTQLGTAVRPWFPTQRLFQPCEGEALADSLHRMARALERLRPHDAPAASEPANAEPANVEPADAESLVTDAVARYRAGEADEVERLCRAALDAAPGHGVALHLLGVLLLRRGEATEATETLVRATASDPGNAAAHAALSDALQALGRFDAAEAAQRHAIAARPDAAEHWVNRTALLRRLGSAPDAERSIRRALRLRPTVALAHTHLGLLRGGLGDAEGAVRSHRRALALSPAGADALVNLGSILQEGERLPDAERLLRRATVVAPEQAAAWSHLGSVLDRLGRVEEALHCHRRALDRAPAMAEALANLGMHHARQLRLDEAREAYLQAVQADPNLPTAHYNLALLLLEGGVLRQGWAEHEWRFDTPQFRGHARRFAARTWRGENVASARLLVWREQGVGDEIFLASCYPDLMNRAGHLVIECDRRLVTLFARSFPGATVRAPTVDPRDVDVQIAAGSLPRLLRPDLKRFPARPWLVPDPVRVALWRKRLDALGPGLKVGIAWRSQLMTGERRALYTALDQWGPVFALPGITFVTVQYGDCAADIAAAEARFGVRIHRWDDLNLKDDFEGVAALMANLDLVISPAMSAGELAGALGVPAWRFGVQDWTQLGTGVRPWFPTMRLFQPRAGMSMGDVLPQIAEQLRRCVSASAPTPAPEVDRLLEQAADHHRAGRLAEAAPLYERVLQAQPNHPVALHLSGLLAHQTGDSEMGAERIGQAIARMPDYAAAQASLGTVLLALGRASAAAGRFRRALALQPSSAAALTNLGNALEAGHDLAGAATAHGRAAAVDPALAEAHDNWGAVLTRLGRLDEGEARHRRAVALAPTRGTGWLNLGVVLRRAGRLNGACHALHRALALEPDAADGLANLGRLLRSMDQMAEAERWSDRALALEPGHPAAAFNKGLLALARGDLEEGWRNCDGRFRARELAGAARVLPVPEWRGEDLSSRRLLVWREQGVGDEILFAGCLPEVIARAGSVIVECDRRLVPLFARSFPTAEVRPSPADPEAPCAGIDRHAGMGSLPRWTRSRLADFPARRSYLVADPERVSHWKERLAALGTGLRVGIAWRSGLMTAERLGAYTTLDDWGPVFAIPGVTFVNLQYGDCVQELQDAERRFGVALHRWPDIDLKDDLDEVAALMSGLDLVIAPSSSVGEMAGALGVPVWRFGHAGDWTALGTCVRPWFPSMDLIVPPRGSSLSSALEAIARRLRTLSNSDKKAGF
ncbi:tetratricopeptide repeat protein [Azospirillum sp. sgz302134]